MSSAVTTLIVIPARWASSRFPGKPLAMIGGRPLLERVVTLVRGTIEGRRDILLTVATDDDRIASFVTAIGCSVTMTSCDATSGSSRALEAALAMPVPPRWVLNVQGDAPFTPPDAITRVLEALQSGAHVATPIVPLSWQELDRLRSDKRETPFSGTTCVCRSNGEALWFSKQIIPAIRQESDQRRSGYWSPVFRHLGLYGYTLEALRQFDGAEAGVYEKLEGLEQLRFIELGMSVQTVCVGSGPIAMSGIDSPEDVARAERLIEAGGLSSPS